MRDSGRDAATCERLEHPFIYQADWSNAPPVPLAQRSALSTFPKTIFIHYTLSRHSSGTVMSVSFSVTKREKNPRKLNNPLTAAWNAHKTPLLPKEKLKRTYTSGGSWCLKCRRLQSLFVFLLARNKERPTQLVFFLHPPSLSADCIAETGLCGSTAPPLRRLLAHFPHAQCSLWDTSRHESPRSRHGGWVNEANTVLWTSILKYDLTQHVSTWKYANALSTLEKPQLNKLWHENGVECTFLSCHYCFVCT